MHVSYIIGCASLQEYNGEQNIYIYCPCPGGTCSEKDNQVTSNIKYGNIGYSRT